MFRQHDRQWWCCKRAIKRQADRLGIDRDAPRRSVEPPGRDEGSAYSRLEPRFDDDLVRGMTFL